MGGACLIRILSRDQYFMLTQLFSRMGKRKKEHGKDKGGSSSETEEEGVGGGENKEGPSLAKKPRTDSEIKGKGCKVEPTV